MGRLSPLLLFGTIVLASAAASFSMTYVDIKHEDGVGPQEVRYWEQEIKSQGAERAIGDLLAISGDWTYYDQHQEMHKFGEALYEVEGTAGVRDCSSEYGFGCFHSLLGLALVNGGLAVVPELEAGCIDRFGQKGLGCQHGIGHGIMAFLGHENLTQALESCQTMAWKGPLGGCMGGVFMEFNFNTTFDHKPRDVDELGEYYPCTTVDEYAKPSCYYNLPMWWGGRSNRDFSLSDQLCSDIPEVQYQNYCYLGIGQIAGQDRKHDVPSSKQICNTMSTSAGTLQCLRGAAILILNDPEHVDDWTDLCVGLPEESLQLCLESDQII